MACCQQARRHTASLGRTCATHAAAPNNYKRRSFVPSADCSWHYRKRAFCNVAPEIQEHATTCELGTPGIDSQHRCISALASDLACQRAFGGFELRVAESTICGGGDGVFVSRGCGASGSRSIPKGTAIALYPGTYFPLAPERIRLHASQGEKPIDSLRLMELYGAGSLDSSLEGVSYDEISSYWLTLATGQGVMDGYSAASRLGARVTDNPYAVGQKVNHPPAGTHPSLVWREFLWRDIEGDAATLAVNRLHTGLWYINPLSMERVAMPPADIVHPEERSRDVELASRIGDREGESIPLPGVALTALRDIEVGEELFVDYKLAWPRPAWYTPVTKYPGRAGPLHVGFRSIRESFANLGRILK